MESYLYLIYGETWSPDMKAVECQCAEEQARTKKECLGTKPFHSWTLE